MTAAPLIRISLEAAVLAGLVALACRFVRMRASHRAMLWWLVAAKLLIGLVPLPAFEIPALPAETTVVAPTFAKFGDSNRIAEQQPIARPNLAIWGWAAVTALLVASTIPGWRRARSWRSRGRPVTDLAIERAARAVGLRRTPEVLAVPGLPSPLVTGLNAPCVLIPDETLERLTPDELEMTLAHEMAHIARGDLWWGLVPALARRIFFFHPAAWLAEREYAIAREAACDEAVLRPGTDAFAYGQLLLRFATRAPVSSTLPMSPHGMLRRRLEMIESVVRRVPIGRAGWALVAVAALSIVPIRLVAKEGEFGSFEKKLSAAHCLDLGDGEDTAYVITSGRASTMCGDISDVDRALAARGTGSDIIWFRAGSGTWIIRDPAAVREGRRYFDDITKLGLAQSEIGREQSAIGADQARIGYEQAEQSFRDAEEARKREVERELAQAEKRTETLDRSREGEAERLEEMARAAAAMDEKLKHQQAEEMEVFAKRQQELGERQAEFGEKQARLAQEVAAAADAAQRAFSRFLDKTMKDGRAQRVN